MALRQTKKISELPALSPASLDTTFVVGISGSTTYKISINQLTSSLDTTFATDLVTATLSGSLDGKLSTSSFNSYTASISTASLVISISNLNTFTASVTTASIVTSISNLNTFTASVSTASLVTSISNLNTFTASQSTSSLVDRLNTIESVSGSWITESETGSFLTSLSGAISSSTQISDLGFVTGSYTTINSFNSLTQSFNSISQSFNVISGSVGTVDFNGIISGSSQLTSSYDTRYTLSGSVQPLPSNLLSSSAQITTFGFVSGSFETTGRSIISSSAQITSFGFISSSTTIDTGSLVTTSSFNSYTASLNAFSSSLSVTANSSTKILDAYYTSAAAWSGSYSGNGGTVKVEANFALYSTSIGTKTFTLFRNGIAVDSGSFYFNNTGVHTTMPTLYYIGTNETGTNTYSVGHNAVSDGGDSCNIVVTETFNTLNAGLISGSSQLTSSYDTRYVISGSVGATPSGTISGSSQLTSSFDSRYTQTGSFNTLTASFNSFTASAQTVTTGSNSFTGTNVFSGSTTLRGAVAIGTSSGDEGGEINLAIASTNQTLTGSVNIDVYRNTLRLWEGGGTNRGVYIDLSKAPDGNTGELTWKASGLVNRGVDVTLGNLKARIAATGNVALQLSTVSGTYSVYGSSVYSLSGVAGTTIDGAAPKAISTTPAYLNLGYNFGTAGATDTWNIMDTSNSIAWRITMILGAGVNNNLVSIERLH